MPMPASWRISQFGPKSLAVKLGAEVADLSEPMREALKDGTASIIDRIARVLEEGCRDAPITAPGDAHTLTSSLYGLWLGARVRAKFDRNRGPVDNALARTREILNI
jgi:TetR/AcrR family transcriptional regulator, transcriptional repressor for nem operon